MFRKMEHIYRAKGLKFINNTYIVPTLFMANY